MPSRVLPVLALVLLAPSLPAQSTARPPHVSEEVLAERAAKDHYGPSWTEVGTASADLSKVVWASRRGGPWVPVVNGKDVGAPVEDLDFALSADGRLLHAGRTAKTWFVWLDGQQVGGPFDEVRRLSFTSAGRPAFAARRGKAWTWFLDRSEVPGTTSELGHFNASDKRVAFGARQPDGWHMVVDGQAGPAFQALIESSFSPDGSRFAYIATRKEGMLAVVDGKEEPVRLAVGWLGWSADSRRVAYLAVDGAKAGAVGRVVADGAPGRHRMARGWDSCTWRPAGRSLTGPPPTPCARSLPQGSRTSRTTPRT